MNAQQLKNAILQEAIEGRLVPQDPNDEPASALLARIRKEKEQLVKAGKLKKKDLEVKPISEDEIPFEIPESWEWVRLKDLVTLITKGSSPSWQGVKYVDKGILFITSENVREGFLELSSPKYLEDKFNNLQSRSILKKGDLLTNIVGASIGRTAEFNLNLDNCNINQAVAIIRLLDKSLNSYFLKVLNSTFIIVQMFGKTVETARPNISLSSVENLIVPLPPLAEQHRIVAKIEELLPKVEEYGKAQDALNKLNAELPERLKNSILQEAIEGRLVPQDPNDEPASVLLAKIRKEKEQLVKAGKLKKKDLIETPISEDELPFEIPNSWEWCRLSDAVYNHGQKIPDKRFSYIDIGSINNKRQCLNSSENIIEAKDAPSRARKIVKKGDIVYSTVRPYLHNIAIVDREFSEEPIASTGFAVFSCLESVYNKFLFYYLFSPSFDLYANDGDNAKGVAYPAINDQKLYKAIIPLPPLAEQHRIVEKLEQLLGEVDKLKK